MTRVQTGGRVSRPNRVAALGMTGAGLVAALAVLAPAASAQQDPGRWQAWIGCWESSAMAAAPTDAPEGRAALCVLPTGDPYAAEFVSIAGGEIESRSTIRGDGLRHELQREGCAGWESAEWSPLGGRLYLRSEFTCPGGAVRSSSGIMAFAPDGDWIDAQTVSVGFNGGVQVNRYRPLLDDSIIPDDVAAAAATGEMARTTARLDAAGRLGPNDVIEATSRVDAGAVEGWLMERGEAFTVDADDLTRLADAGVPVRVIDMLVALSYPEVFAVEIPDREEVRRYPGARRGPYWDPWYGGWYPYGRRYGGWYGGYPQVIVVRNPSGAGSNGGRAVKGGGYRRGGSSGGGGEDTTRPSSGGSTTKSGDSGRDRSSTGRTARPKGE